MDTQLRKAWLQLGIKDEELAPLLNFNAEQSRAVIAMMVNDESLSSQLRAIAKNTADSLAYD
ncbi:hypothetical protein ACFSJY_14385 [Thalassotalea euphylliae]|uniref:hypothetical protein n=1 Tax=Thalassotalea euphylliae TaxID=1655234 RepID=UPI0036365BC6